jgi:hypothetical protein
MAARPALVVDNQDAQTFRSLKARLAAIRRSFAEMERDNDRRIAELRETHEMLRQMIAAEIKSSSR